MKLKIATDLSLPLELVTQTIAILAKRRAGKSYTMRRLIEQLFTAGQQVVIVDPKGDQWGLRSAASGKDPGLPIVILGGERGDVPLEANAGEVVAKLVVEERVSVLLDLSTFRKHEVATFMTVFMENLYRLKAKEIYRTPVMLVIDEADAIAPQKPQKGEERMLGAAEDIVRRGGQRGIGCVLVTQRSAVLNKNVLTQAQVLVVLRTIAPQDLAAMKAWIDVHGDVEQGRTLMDSLPSLPVGDAWFWSPGWPTTAGIFKRVHVLPIETFDSGKSPEPGVKPVEPKHLADVDLDALKGQMAATIEKAKAEDPRELRKQIATLKAENSKLSESSNRPNSLTKPEVKRVEVLTDADRALLARVVKALAESRESLVVARDRLAHSVHQQVYDLFAELTKLADTASGKAQKEFLQQLEGKGFQKILVKLSTMNPEPEPRSPQPGAMRPAKAGPVRPPAPRSQGNGTGGDVASGERKILTAVAQYPDGATREQLSLLAGFKRSTRDRYLQFLAQKGYVESRGTLLIVTQAGLTALGAFDPLPIGDELLAHWLRELPSGEALILSAVAKAHPTPLDRDAISEATNFKRSTRDRYLQFLQARKLVQVERDGVRAAVELFG